MVETVTFVQRCNGKSQTRRPIGKKILKVTPDCVNSTKGPVLSAVMRLAPKPGWVNVGILV